MIGDKKIKNLDPRLKAKLKMPVVKNKIDIIEKDLNKTKEKITIINDKIEDKSKDSIEIMNNLIKSNNSLENKIDNFLDFKSELDNVKVEINTINKQISNIVDILQTITILNNKVFQLTWKSKIGFIYNLDDFKLIDSFN